MQRVAGRHALAGLKSRRAAARGLSDLLHANRVEGLAPGAGLVWRGGGGGGGLELRVRASYGFADRRPKGAVAVTEGRGGRGQGFELSVYREVRDVADVTVIAPMLNSIAAQEFGDDYGDYFLAEGGRLTYRHSIGSRGDWSAALGRERSEERRVGKECRL